MSDFLSQITGAGVGVWEWIGRTNPDAWAAGAGWTTVIIALVASIAAFRQVREARTLREEQAQPYAVAFMESSQASEHIIDLVVKNFGTTVARNVRMECKPPLQRSSSDGPQPEDVKVFDALPILVPGQEWRIFWDSGIARKDANLPDRYELTIRYEDSRGKEMSPTQAVLDWGFYRSRMWTEIFGQHHAAKALREISSSLKKSTEPGGGLRAFVRDGDAKDERRRKAAAEMHSRLQDLNARVLPRGNEGATYDAGSSAEGPLQTLPPSGVADLSHDVEPPRSAGSDDAA